MTAVKTPCPSGKKRYASAKRANGVLSHIWSKPRPGRRLETRFYHCPDCNGWHLTSQPQPSMAPGSRTHSDLRGNAVPPQPIRQEVPVPAPPPSCPCCTSNYLPVLHNARCASGLHIGGCGHPHAQHRAARQDQKRAS